MEARLAKSSMDAKQAIDRNARMDAEQVTDRNARAAAVNETNCDATSTRNSQARAVMPLERDAHIYEAALSSQP